MVQRGERRFTFINSSGSGTRWVSNKSKKLEVEKVFPFSVPGKKGKEHRQCHGAAAKEEQTQQLMGKFRGLA